MAHRLQVIPLSLLRNPPRKQRMRGEIATAQFLFRSWVRRGRRQQNGWYLPPPPPIIQYPVTQRRPAEPVDWAEVTAVFLALLVLFGIIGGCIIAFS
jgi:hypothetical protein